LMLGGIAYRLSPLVPITSATEFGPLLPTITRHDYRGGCKPERTARMRETSQRGLDLPSLIRLRFPESTGLLDPSWAEGHMGFPIGWTELPPSETP
jgi:hypothetical protein